MTQQACTVKNLSVQFAHEPLFQHLNFELPTAQCSASDWTQWSRQININVPTHSGAHAQLCEWRSDLAYVIFLLKSARAFKQLYTCRSP